LVSIASLTTAALSASAPTVGAQSSGVRLPTNADPGLHSPASTIRDTTEIPTPPRCLSNADSETSTTSLNRPLLLVFRAHAQFRIWTRSSRAAHGGLSSPRTLKEGIPAAVTATRSTCAMLSLPTTRWRIISLNNGLAVWKSIEVLRLRNEFSYADGDQNSKLSQFYTMSTLYITRS
jgi:hypothetical protein